MTISRRGTGPGPIKDFTAYNLGTAKSILKEVGPKVKSKTVRGFYAFYTFGKASKSPHAGAG